MENILRQVNLRELESIKYNDDVKKSFLCLHDYGYDFEKGKPGFTIDELDDFIKLVEKHDLSSNCDNVEGYYLGYVTENSGIREQFDIVRPGNDNILNIELKSKFPNNKMDKKGNIIQTGKDRIKNQLLRHKKYLSVSIPVSEPNNNVYVFCYCSNDDQLFSLDKNGELISVGIEKLINAIKLTNSRNHKLNCVDLSSMMISPYTESEKFANHTYFLTDEQMYKKSEIINNKKKKFVILGGPGTGKTLLLFDLAKYYADRGKTVKVFLAATLDYNVCQELNNKYNFEVSSITTYNSLNDRSYDVLIIDEAQRLYNNVILNIDNFKNLNRGITIFSIDEKQALHDNEYIGTQKFLEDVKRDNDACEVIKLKDKIRYDPVMSDFIKRLISNNHDTVPNAYPHVNVIYSGSLENTQNIILDKQKQNYISIELTGYTTKTTQNITRRKRFSGTEEVHKVQGREYNNVLFIMDDWFRYTEKGIVGNYKNYYPYLLPRMAFEALTRVKRNLTILVVNNPELYVDIQKILNAREEYLAKQNQKKSENKEELTKINNILLKDNKSNGRFEIISKYISNFAEDNNLNIDSVIAKLRAITKKQ